MAVDASVYGLSGRGVRSVADYDREAEELLGLKQQRAQQAEMGALNLMLGRQKADEYTRGLQRANELRGLGGGWNAQTTDEQRIADMRNKGFHGEADALEKTLLERGKAKATIGKDDAEAASKKLADRIKGFEFHVQRVGEVKDLPGAEAWITQAVQGGYIPMQQATAVIQKLRTNPAALPEWKEDTLLGGMSAVEQAKAAEAAKAARSTQANQMLVPGADGTFEPNLPYIGAKKMIAKAGAASVNVNTGQKGLDNERDLRNDFRAEPIVKAYEDMAQAHKQIKAGLSQENPVGDLAAATKIMKLLDPGSVVRESELAMAMAASGRLDRLQNFVQLQITGQKLTPTQRKEFATLADELMSAAGQAHNVKQSEYANMGGRYKLDTSVLGKPWSPTTATPSKPTGQPAKPGGPTVSNW